jgi:hypothetical protein
MCQLDQASGDEGYVIVACQVTPNRYGQLPVLQGPSKLINQSAPNVQMSWSYLISEFHFYNRSYKIGTWMNKEWQFFTWKYTRNQTDISIPGCCLEINPYQLVSTTLGDGEIKEFTLELKTGEITLILCYDYE